MVPGLNSRRTYDVTRRILTDRPNARNSQGLRFSIWLLKCDSIARPTLAPSQNRSVGPKMIRRLLCTPLLK